jgi:hypothetical protein
MAMAGVREGALRSRVRDRSLTYLVFKETSVRSSSVLLFGGEIGVRLWDENWSSHNCWDDDGRRVEMQEYFWEFLMETDTTRSWADVMSCR